MTHKLYKTFEKVMSAPQTLCLSVFGESGKTHLQPVESWEESGYQIGIDIAKARTFTDTRGRSQNEGVIHYKDIMVDVREITKHKDFYLIK